MFPLFTKTFPASAEELAEKLNASLARIFILPIAPVSVRASNYPAVDEIVISLDGAEVRDDPPRPVSSDRIGDPALRIADFTINGSGITAGGASANINVRARGVDLNAAATKDGNLVLVVKNADAGRVEVATSKAAVESLIADVAKREAGKHGVTIDNVRLNLQSNGPRSLAAEVQLRARKLFLSASIRIAGRLDVDEHLSAQLSGLKCEGEGAIATMACGVLSPHLQKLNGRQFSLMALPLGDVRLRDIQIAVAEKISVTAEFGRA